MCLAVTVHVFTSSNPKPVSGSISHSDKHLRPEWELEDPEEDAAEVETSKRPDIGGHPNKITITKTIMITITLQGIPITRNTKCPVVARCQISSS